MSTTESDLDRAVSDDSADDSVTPDGQVAVDRSDDDDDTAAVDPSADDEADGDADHDSMTAADADVEAVSDIDAEVHGDADLDADTELDGDDDETYELPEIVLVSEADDDDAAAAAAADAATDYVVPEVSEDILEELRRADIDGPIVQAAPQDDETNARRRPKRSADFDPSPVPIPLRVPRILGRKPRVRKVTRVVRHLDPWSVFKIASIAFLVLYVIVMTAGVLLWNVAYATGTVENVERFFESFGWSTFEFNGGEIYHAAWIAGLFAVVGFTGLAVLTATLFNLITDLVGGVRVTVLEEEVVEARSTPMRRFVVRRPEPEVPAVIHDESGTITREAIPEPEA